jgi:hypothetical protein
LSENPHSTGRWNRCPKHEPYIEIEGSSEEAVKQTAEKLGLDYSKALFCSVDTLYARKYGLSEDYICNEIKRICFEEENPFVKEN